MGKEAGGKELGKKQLQGQIAWTKSLFGKTITKLEMVPTCCTRCSYKHGIFNFTRGTGLWDKQQEGMELGWAAELLWGALKISMRHKRHPESFPTSKERFQELLGTERDLSHLHNE